MGFWSQNCLVGWGLQAVFCRRTILTRLANVRFPESVSFDRAALVHCVEFVITWFALPFTSACIWLVLLSRNESIVESRMKVPRGSALIATIPPVPGMDNVCLIAWGVFTFSTLLCFEVIADAYPLCQSKLERALESPKAVTPCRASWRVSLPGSVWRH